jgi:hypothetical protein
MRRTEEGIVVRREEREQLTLRLPMRAGDSWRIDFPDQDLADCTVGGEEELDVLGRRMKCTRLEVVRTSREDGRATTDQEWYAPGLGLVRMRVTKAGITQTFVLQAYEK